MKVGFAEFLTIIFMALKLLGFVSWSWWLVLMPGILAMCAYIIVWLVWLFHSVKLNKQGRKL